MLKSLLILSLLSQNPDASSANSSTVASSSAQEAVMLDSGVLPVRQELPALNIEIPVPKSDLPLTEWNVVLLGDMLVKAVEDQNWRLFTALLLMLAVYFANKFIIPRIEEDAKFEKYKEFIPVLTALLSAIGATAAIAFNKNFSIVQAVSYVITLTTMSMGYWQITKKLVPLPKPASKKKKKE